MEWSVTVCGLVAAGAALLLRRPPPRIRRSIPQTFQEAVIAFDGGFTPAVVVLSRGLEAKLRIRRDDRRNDAEQIRIPALNLERTAPPLKTTTIDVATGDEGVYDITSSSGAKGTVIVMDFSH